MYRLVIAAGIILCVVLSNPLSAGQLHVAKTDSDANAGASGSPFF